MELLFKPRNLKYIGDGTLPHGMFNSTSKWQPITKYLEKGAKKFPKKTMFKVADNKGNIVSECTYEQTNKWANRVSNGLRANYGIKKGDRIGIYMLNSVEYVISILGIHKSGSVQVPINKDEKGDRLKYIINYSEMKAIIIDEASLKYIQQIAKDLHTLKYIFVTADSSKLPKTIEVIRTLTFNTFKRFPSDNPKNKVKVSDVERCMFTSGTTGMPKGVSRNHGGIILTVRGFIQQQGIRSEDVIMSILTLGHANSQVMCLFASIGAGATAVFYPKFSASRFWKWAGECGATQVNMLGAVSTYIWATKPSKWDKKHSVRTVLSGPAPRNLEEFQDRFNTRIIDGYGSTEMGMVTWKDLEDKRPGSSGYPMEGYYLEIRDPENISKVIRPFWDPSETPTPPEEAKGLLFIKPLIPHTTLNEYFKDERRTREAFDDDGFFNSDDLFAQGIDRRFYFQGRFSRIRVSGENVDPIAVQDIAMEYEPIQEAVALGVRLPDVADDEIKLSITLNKGADFDPVKFSEWMANKAPVFMVPRFIEVYEKGFPVTTTQKIRVAKIKEITEKTWDRNKTGLKLKAR